jgi:hypothetical protein
MTDAFDLERFVVRNVGADLAATTFLFSSVVAELTGAGPGRCNWCFLY